MQKNPSTTQELLRNVQMFLDAGEFRQAICALKNYGVGTPELRNAYGVCLMRAGDYAKAIDVLRPLALHSESVCFQETAPVTYLANYATALLLSGNVSGCEAALNACNGRSDDYVRRVRSAVDAWRRSLGLLGRAAFLLYGTVPSKKKFGGLDFPPGRFQLESQVEAPAMLVG